MFSFGANNAKACPTKTRMIIAEACEVAASAAGRPYRGTVSLAMLPTGCVWLSAGGSFYYNAYYVPPQFGQSGATHGETGVGHAAAQPVCAGAPSS